MENTDQDSQKTTFGVKNDATTVYYSIILRIW